MLRIATLCVTSYNRSYACLIGARRGPVAVGSDLCPRDHCEGGALFGD
jgi:hypothetical protein